MKINKLTTLLLLAAAVSANAAELSQTGQFVDGIAAIVDDGVVLKSDLQNQVALITRRARESETPMQLPPPNVLREQLLERLILKEIQMQRAERIGLQISDAALNDAIARIATQNNVRFEDLPALLAQDGIDYAVFRREVREEITLDQLRLIDVGRRISVSPREIQQCIADLEGNVVVNSDYNLSHILISVPESATAAEIDAAQKEAREVYEQIVAGADFGEMAIRHSDAQTALEGGALGWLRGEQLPTLYTDVIAGMGRGDVSEPFRRGSSLHIVKVNDLRSAVERSEIEQVRVRHILITPNEIIDDQTAKQRLDDARERIANGENFGEIAKLLSDDPGSANNGGEMTWAGPGTFVPEFEEVVDASDIGVVSEPFRTRFGWHIVEVLERRVYDNTEDLKEENCDARIRNSKMEDETQLWMQRLRDEAYVEKRI